MEKNSYADPDVKNAVVKLSGSSSFRSRNARGSAFRGFHIGFETNNPPCSLPSSSPQLPPDLSNRRLEPCVGAEFVASRRIREPVRPDARHPIPFRPSLWWYSRRRVTCTQPSLPRFYRPSPIPNLPLSAWFWWLSNLLIETAAIQRVEHVAIRAGAAVGIARVEHVPHVQPASCRGAGRRCGRRRHAALGRLHGRIRGAVRRGRMAAVVVCGLR